MRISDWSSDVCSSDLISGFRQRDETPKYLASIFGTKTVALTSDVGMRIGGGVRYQGKQMSDPFGGLFVVETPSYTLVDALMAFDYKAWTLQFNAINLFDDRYYPGCSEIGRAHV